VQSTPRAARSASVRWEASSRSPSSALARAAAAAGFQLVGEARGDRAERGEPLPLVHHAPRVRHPEEDALQQVRAHREPLADGLGELAGREPEHPRRAGRPQRVLVALLDLVAQVRLHGAAVGAGPVRPADLHGVAPDVLGHHHLAVQQHVQELGGVSLRADHAVRRVLLHRPVLRQPGELLLVEVLEEEQPPQLLR
jgi:hypothetical protein